MAFEDRIHPYKSKYSGQDMDSAFEKALSSCTKSEVSTLIAAETKSRSAADKDLQNSIDDVKNDTVANTRDIGTLQAKTAEETAYRRAAVGLTAKNLLPKGTTQTINGVTFTVNGDGTVTANGTAADLAIFRINATLSAGSYTMSGYDAPTTSTVNCSVFNRSNYSGLAALNTNPNFSVSSETPVEFRCVVYKGYTADNVVFQPMIRDSAIADDSYAPYVPSLQEQIAELRALIQQK